MTALSESLLPMLICGVFSLLILNFLHFIQVGKPILDTHLHFSWIRKPILDKFLLTSGARASNSLIER